MNKQSLYLFGGALMATTALASQANAAQFKSWVFPLPSTSAISTKSLATEVFSATTTVANAVSIGGNTTSTANAILVDFASQLTAGFNVQVNVTNAAFTGTPTVVVYGQTTTGSMVVSSVTSCAVQALPDKLLITGCTPQGSSSLSRADAMAIFGITYYSASALATAGQTIKLDGLVTNSAGSITFENITAATIVTSKSAAEASVQAGSALTVDNNATPVFSKFTTGSATASLGTIHFSATGAVGTDLSNTFGSAASITGNAEVKVSASALSDAALISVSIQGLLSNLSATPAAFVSGTVTFTVPGASLSNATIAVTFDGSTGISAMSGASATVTPATGPTGIIKAVSAFSGNLATVSRGGLSVELNSLFPSSAGINYQSVLRISNISTIDGTATLTVKDDSTGATIGSFTTTVTAGATRQIMVPAIEAAVSGAAATGHAYKVIVTGSFNGYVQNLLFNATNGVFTDLSGFRNGLLTIDP